MLSILRNMRLGVRPVAALSKPTMLSLASRSVRVSPRFFMTSATVEEPQAAAKSKSKVVAKKSDSKKPAAKKSGSKKKPAAKKPGSKTKVAAKKSAPKKKVIAARVKKTKEAVPRNRIFVVSKDMFPPKQPAGTFVRFVGQESAKYPTRAASLEEAKQRMVELAGTWKTLSQEQKDAYKASEEEVAAYQAAKEAWRERTPPDIVWAFKHKGQAKGKGKVHLRIANEKKKYSPYILFLKHFHDTDYALEKESSENAIRFGSHAAKAWRALSEEERQTWRDKSVVAKEELAAKAEAGH